MAPTAQRLRRLAGGALLMAATTQCPAAAPRALDRFNYPSAEEAATTWVAKDGSPRVQVEKAGGLRFPCPFRGERDRVYWDRAVRLDLSDPTAFELEVSCDRPEALRSLALYFKSGNGWYAAMKPLTEPGRHRLVFSKQEFAREGRPAGWQAIEAIRISPWKGAAVNTEVVAHSLAAFSSDLFLVQATGSAPNDAERNMSKRVAQRISRWLSDVNVSHVIINDEDVAGGALAGGRIAVLCYNPNPSSGQLAALRSFSQGGGKLLVFYSSSAELARLLGFRLGEYKRSDRIGAWSSWAFIRPAELHLPPRVFQDSPNIRPVHPDGGSARVLAYWENAEGQRTEDTAWVMSPAGAWMSHILLEGDGRRKQRMLLGLLSAYDPGVLRAAARRELERAGKIGPYPNLAESMRGLRAMADDDRLRDQLTRVALTHQEMLADFKRAEYGNVLDRSDQLNRELLEVYARAQAPRTRELRGVWDHDGVGWYPGRWDETCRILAGRGLNAVFPNMLWGGLAHYPSAVLPRSVTFKRYGDQVEQCVEAARQHGLQVHLWTVCWSLGNAPAEFADRLRREGRMQVTARGEKSAWLCPSHPANVSMLINSLAEVVRAYRVDGIHLDYIRYPGPESCYCPTCREAFEKWSGAGVADWPKDAAPGGRRAESYRRFRVDRINLVVRGIHNQVRSLRPGLQISAAVFPRYPDCIDSVGQDWRKWLEAGYVDFVAPMNYTINTPAFAAMTHQQIKAAGAGRRVMPGIGVTSNESELRPDQVIDQILALREQKAGGFVLFDLSHTLRDDVLPFLQMGVTRP